MTTTNVRYISADVDRDIAFYTDQLGFAVECILRRALQSYRVETCAFS